MDKEDLRIIKTKNKLSNALLTLLKEKPIKEIKISELCELAGISRATFYNNFNSVEEVFTYDILRFEEPFEKNLNTEIQNVDFDDVSALSRIWKSYVFPLVEGLEKKRDDLNVILEKQTLSGDFYMSLLNLMKGVMKRLLDIYKTKFNVPIPDDLAVSYASGGITSLVATLLMSGDEYTLEEKQYYVYHIVFELSDYYFEHHQENN
jgi:AcrR family transcriptional regulator